MYRIVYISKRTDRSYIWAPLKLSTLSLFSKPPPPQKSIRQTSRTFFERFQTGLNSLLASYWSAPPLRPTRARLSLRYVPISQLTSVAAFTPATQLFSQFSCDFAILQSKYWISPKDDHHIALKGSSHECEGFDSPLFSQCWRHSSSISAVGYVARFEAPFSLRTVLFFSLRSLFRFHLKGQLPGICFFNFQFFKSKKGPRFFQKKCGPDSWAYRDPPDHRPFLGGSCFVKESP